MQTRIILIVLTIFIFELLCSCSSNLSQEKKSKDLFNAFQANLESELKAALKNHGLVGAVSACSIKSPQLESSMVNEDYSIKRISQKPRNPSHFPDTMEKEVLEQWQNMISKNENPGFVFRESQEYKYYLKPIIIKKQLCLKCHGPKISLDDELKKKIFELYPADRAIGYKIGDLRGAFVARWTKSRNRTLQ